MKTLRCLLALAALVMATATWAAVPTTIDFQGYVRDSGTGQPMTGQHILTTSLFGDITGGMAVWTENDTLTFDGGVFSTKLGDVEPLTISLFQDPTLFLEATVDGNLSGPRTQLVSVPFAMFAQVAQQAAHADSSGYATHAAYADSAGNGGEGDANWAKDGNDIHNTNSGNVGIGTDNPQIKIDVENGDVGVHKEGMAALFAADQYGGNLWSNNNYDRLNPGLGWYRTMTWKDGNIGIGTRYPSGKVSILGGYRATSLPADQGIHFGSLGNSPDMGQLWWGDNTGWKFHMGTRATNGDFVPRFTFQDFGRLGIGTTSPQYPLDVNGIISSLAGGFRFPDGTIQPTAAGSGLWSANGSSIYYNNGNVGVGTSTPESRFTVQCQQLTHRGFRITDGTNNSNIVIQPLPGENSGFQAINFNGYYDGTEVRLNPAKNRWRIAADQRGTADQFSIDTQSATGGTQILTAMTDGRLGIGTSSPDSHYRIHVEANTNVDQGEGLHVVNNDTNHNTFAILGQTNSRTNGIAPGQDGARSAVGVYGRARSSVSTGGATLGVLGINNAETTSGDVAAGVFGQAPGDPPQGEAPSNFGGK